MFVLSQVFLELHRTPPIGFGLVSWFDERVYKAEAVAGVGGGKHSWKVPSDLDDLGNHYWKVRINDNVNDQSETFEIVRQPGIIKVTKPEKGKDTSFLSIFGAKGRQVFVANSKVAVAWTVTDMPSDATYSIHLYHDNGLLRTDTVVEIAKQVTGTTYTYTVPAGMKDSDDYFFRVTRAGYPSSFDDSELFELKKAELAFVTPDPRGNALDLSVYDDVFEEGQRVQVKWTNQGIPADATMTILLMDYDFGIWNADDLHTTLTTTATNTGEAWVDIPKNTLRLDDQYYFRILWNADKRVEASTKNFKVTRKEGTINVVKPAKASQSQSISESYITPPLFFGAQFGFEMCFFGPSTLGAGAKTRLESRIKKFTPHCVCRVPS